MLGTVVHDVLRQRGIESRHIGEEMFARRVHIHTHGVYTTLHSAVQRRFQFILVHIVLVLPYSDGFGVNLYELGQGVHQATTDRDGTTHRNIIVGELIARHLRSRVDGSTILAHHEDLQRAVVTLRGDKLLSLTAGRTVTNGYGLYLVLLHQACQLASSTSIVRLGRMGKYRFIMQQIALCIKTHHLASRTVTGVNGKHTLLPERRCQQQLLEVSCKHTDCLLVGLLFGTVGILRFDGRTQQSLVAILHRQGYLLGTLSRRTHILAFEASDSYCVIGRSNAHPQESLVLATADGQHAVR